MIIAIFFLMISTAQAAELSIVRQSDGFLIPSSGSVSISDTIKFRIQGTSCVSDDFEMQIDGSQWLFLGAGWGCANSVWTSYAIALQGVTPRQYTISIRLQSSPATMTTSVFTVTPAVTSLPTGWVKVADEGQPLSLQPGTQVAYGTNNRFFLSAFTAETFVCGNGAFGDPAWGFVKECYIAARTSNNVPVVANPIPDQTTFVGMAFSYAFPANTYTDADGDLLTYSAMQAGGAPLPAWLTFTPATRTFFGTPPSGEAYKTYNITVIAGDGLLGGTVADTFRLVVIGPVP